MTPFWLGVLVGAMLGACVGLLGLSLCVAAGRGR
jgi:hypothetical protein